MIRSFALLAALALLTAAVPAHACSMHSDTTAQSTPVVTSDANGTAPSTPVSPPSTTATKTGG